MGKWGQTLKGHGFHDKPTTGHKNWHSVLQDPSEHGDSTKSRVGRKKTRDWDANPYDMRLKLRRPAQIKKYSGKNNGRGGNIGYTGRRTRYTGQSSYTRGRNADEDDSYRTAAEKRNEVRADQKRKIAAWKKDRADPKYVTRAPSTNEEKFLAGKRDKIIALLKRKKPQDGYYRYRGNMGTGIIEKKKGVVIK